MRIKIRCPECGATLRAGLEHAGKQAKCSGCGHKIRLPDREAMERTISESAPRGASTATVRETPPPEPPPEAMPSPELVESELFANDPFPIESTNPFASPVSQETSPFSAGVPNSLGFAGFLRRFAAMVVDTLLLVLLWVVVLFSTGVAVGILVVATGGDPGDAEAIGESIGEASPLIWIVLAVVYYAGMESSAGGATLGKRLTGVRVVTSEGQRISFGRGVGRYFAKFLSSLILGVGYLMAAFTDRKQALHDMVVGTVVVRSR